MPDDNIAAAIIVVPMEQETESIALAVIGADRIAARGSVFGYIGALREGLPLGDSDPDLERTVAAAVSGVPIDIQPEVRRAVMAAVQVPPRPHLTRSQAETIIFAEIARRQAIGVAPSPKLETSMPNHKPITAAELKAEIVAKWRDDANIRGEFSSFGAYQAYREGQFCKEHGLRREALAGALVDVEAHVATLNRARHAQQENLVDSHELEEIKARAKEWEASVEIRSEFGSFGAYDSYQRWHKAGRIKSYRGAGGI